MTHITTKYSELDMVYLGQQPSKKVYEKCKLSMQTVKQRSSIQRVDFGKFVILFTLFLQLQLRRCG